MDTIVDTMCQWSLVGFIGFVALYFTLPILADRFFNTDEEGQ